MCSELKVIEIDHENQKIEGGCFVLARTYGERFLQDRSAQHEFQFSLIESYLSYKDGLMVYRRLRIDECDAILYSAGVRIFLI